MVTLSFLMIFGLMAAPIHAQIPSSGDPIGTTPPREVGVSEVLSTIFGVAFWLLLAIAGIFFLLGAFYFLTAGQNPDNTSKGKSIITYAIIAIIVAILARGIAAFIPGVFGV